MKVFSVAEMVAAERAADAAGTSYAEMMERAGQAVAEAIMARYPVAGKAVTVLVGPGNNGGDGLVAGRHLAAAGADVAFYLSRSRQQETDPQYAQVLDLGLPVLEAGHDRQYRVLRHRLHISDILIDALLGTGVNRPIGGEMATLMRQAAGALAERRRILAREGASTLASVAAYHPPLKPRPLVVAVDCPSGLNCDTGALDSLALPAGLTVTFAGPKRGHFIFPGAGACGELVVADIGIDPALPQVAGVSLELLTAEQAAALMPPRPLDGHKGTFGKALILAGQAQYWGAPVLAGRAAYRAGCGLVALAVPAAIRPTVAGQLPEATFPPVPDQDTLGPESVAYLLAAPELRPRAILVGPGTGPAAPLMEALLAQQKLPPLVVDADGLNALAALPDWPARLPANTILTPHPGEMARLAGISLAELKAQERVTLSQERAAAWGHILLLKGAYTVIAAPDGRTALLPFANPALAVGGTGDVLAGVIVSLLAQGLEPYQAALLGGFLHGAAAERAVEERGLSGILAGELADHIPAVCRLLRQ